MTPVVGAQAEPQADRRQRPRARRRQSGCGANWGATLGGGYYVWRSGLGITRDGRVIFVYGPALDVQDLADLLQRAGAVEAMQLDINPYWMSYEYYQAKGHPADPTPVNLLPTQQQTRVPLLLRVQPGLHRGLRPVTAERSATEVAVPRPAPVSSAVRLRCWLAAVVRTTRPRQWPKNLLVFAAPLAGATFGRPDGLGYALVAAVAFGWPPPRCTSSTTSPMPNATGGIRSSGTARWRRVSCRARTRSRWACSPRRPRHRRRRLAYRCSSRPPAYLCSSFLYSAGLKHIPLVEMLLVASGFLLRVLGGAAATHVPPSGWFLLVCSLGALGVAVAKRYTELTGLGAAPFGTGRCCAGTGRGAARRPVGRSAPP